MEVWVVRMDPGEHATVTEVMVLGIDTVTVAEPCFVVSWVEVAVRVAVPGAVGVKTPEEETEPTEEGDADHVTVEL